MQKFYRASARVWSMAVAVISMVIIAPHYFRWFEQRVGTVTREPSSRVAEAPEGNETALASSGIRKLSPQVPAAVPRITGRHAWETPHEETRPSRVAIDPEQVLQGLTSPDPTAQLAALKSVAQFADTMYVYDKIYRRILELGTGEDQQLAKRARFVRSRLADLRTRHEIPEPSAGSAGDGATIAEEAGLPRDELETAVEPLEVVRERALDDPDPAVRMSGIESAIRQRDEHTFDVLSQAARFDYDPDNRMIAVNEMEQMLKSGLGDRDRILSLLEETANDSDRRIAELSQVILKEQGGEEASLELEGTPSR